MNTPNLRLILWVAGTIAFTGCQAKKGSGDTTAASSANVSSAGTPGSTSTSSSTSGTTTTSGPGPLTVGVRNFDQVNATMETVTGVMGNSKVVARFTALKGQLPTTNEIQAFSFSGQGAVTVLAAEYCTALVQNGGNAYTSQLATAIGTFNVKAVPTTAITAASSAALAQSLITQFWGTGYANNANAAAAEQNVEQLLTDLSTGQPNTVTTTQNAVIGACTSVLAAAPTSVF